jgi:multicomponent Na+:H+ antiporter subunit C
MNEALLSQPFLYSASAVALFCIGLYRLIISPHIIRKILAINIMGIGIFMLLIAGAVDQAGPPDPVPHAMVLTGIVVAIAGTALALSLVARIHALSSDTRVHKSDE